MLAWLDSLTVLELVLLCTAVPASLLLIIQTLLLFIGLGGDHDATADSPDGNALIDLDHGGDVTLDLDDGTGGLVGDAHFDLHAGHCDACGGEHNAGDHHDGAGGGLHILTLRGIVAFFTLFGWSGLLFSMLGLHWLLSLFLAVQVGVIGMVAVALILREALRLQSDGTLNIRNALGLSGTVYLTVPAARREPGKVNVTVQDQLREFEAVTDSETPIPTGADIRVVGITGGDTLIVEAVFYA